MIKINLILLLLLQLAATQIFGQSISFPDKALVTDSAGRPVETGRNLANIKKLNDSLYYVAVDIASGTATMAGDIDVMVRCVAKDNGALEKLKKAFHWLPNINSGEGQIVSQHVFRSPCIIQCLENRSVVLIPDLNLLAENRIAPYYLKLGYTDNALVLHYGISAYKVVPHQYYKKSGESFRLSGTVRIGFYLLMPKTTEPTALLKLTNAFLWQHVARDYTSSVLPQTVGFTRYAETGYNMALEHFWTDAGNNKGGITLSTYRDPSTNEYRGRFFKNDLWYQSWFNNLRTAYGLYCWGGQLQKNDWKEKALQIVNLLMDAPSSGGWFPTLYNTEAGSWIASGTGPANTTAYYVPDNCWTAYWLLRFNDEMRATANADHLLLGLSSALLALQNTDGSFPAFVNVQTQRAESLLNSSASSAMATWYLEELLLRKKISATQKSTYEQAIKRSLAFLTEKILPRQKFEDFESYFSCSPKPMDYFDSSTGMFSQNTLSIQWCAEAFLKAYHLFGDKVYLEKGEYCLNILSLYQQVWNPPFISLYAFGGFGAQNTDAEWNDARQAQFADTYLQYYQVTKNKEYLERGIYACRASFALMVLPENKEVCPKNYQGTRVNGESWPGSMAENYGHSGNDSRSYQSGFHWGTGSALTTAAIFKNTLGDLYINFDNRIAEGVDGIVVTEAKWDKTPAINIERIDEKAQVTISSPAAPGRKIMLNNKAAVTNCRAFSNNGHASVKKN